MIRYWYIRSQSLVSGGWEIEFIAATGFDMFATYCWVVVEPTSLKRMKVCWDDDIHNIWKITNVPNHQPDIVCMCTVYIIGILIRN